MFKYYSVFNKDGFPDGRGSYDSREFKRRFNYLMFCAVWTTLFGLAYVLFILSGSLFHLASIASSAFWLILTIIFWGELKTQFTSYTLN